MRKKKEAGAGFVQTQMIMEKENLIEFCEKISNPLEIPVIAGVFLLKSYKNALFINKYVPGANIPENILNRLKDAKNPLQEGIKIAAAILIPSCNGFLASLRRFKIFSGMFAPGTYLFMKRAFL